MIDHYQVLNVSRDCEPEVINAAYRALMKKFHPDQSRDPEAKAKAQRINEAFQTLSDPARRRAYDLQFERADRAKTSAPPPASRAPRGPSPRPTSPPPPPPPAGLRFRGRGGLFERYGWVIVVVGLFALFTIPPIIGQSLEEREEATLSAEVTAAAHRCIQQIDVDRADDIERDFDTPSMALSYRGERAIQHRAGQFEFADYGDPLPRHTSNSALEWSPSVTSRASETIKVLQAEFIVLDIDVERGFACRILWEGSDWAYDVDLARNRTRKVDFRTDFDERLRNLPPRRDGVRRIIAAAIQ